MGQNYILQFGETLEPPFVQTDAAYDADPNRAGGWPAPEVVPQDFLNKLHLQGLVVASGLSQFIADNQDDDVVDTLSPDEYAALLLLAIQAVGAVTQPKFDDSAEIATDEFVQNALGNFSGTYTVTTNTILTGTECGMVGIIGANTLTVSLPETAGIPDGVVICLVGNGFGDTTIQRQDTDVISLGLNGAALSFITLLPQDTIQLVKSGGVWVTYEGSAYLQGSSTFQHSNTLAGYTKLPGGLILQWGFVTVTNNVTLAINLPIAWPVGMLNGQVSHNTFSTPGNVQASFLNIASNGLSQITIRWGSDLGGALTCNVFYFVIGR